MLSHLFETSTPSVQLPLPSPTSELPLHLLTINQGIFTQLPVTDLAVKPRQTQIHHVPVARWVNATSPRLLLRRVG